MVLEIAAIRSYLAAMPSTFDFCIPTRATTVPDTPDWLHEIKYDGYRLRLERDGDHPRVRLNTVTIARAGNGVLCGWHGATLR